MEVELFAHQIVAGWISSVVMSNGQKRTIHDAEFLPGIELGCIDKHGEHDPFYMNEGEVRGGWLRSFDSGYVVYLKVSDIVEFRVTTPSGG